MGNKEYWFAGHLYEQVLKRDDETPMTRKGDRDFAKWIKAFIKENEGDDLYEQAVEEVSKHAKVSTSFLQRKLKVGYNRAALLMELLEENGVVGSADSGKAREVLIRSEESEESDSHDLD